MAMAAVPVGAESQLSGHVAADWVLDELLVAIVAEIVAPSLADISQPLDLVFI